MGFLDKAKAQAQQVAAKAQQGVSQGQAKLDTMQAKKQADGLLRDLGAAFYAEQRSGGTRDAVTAALAAVDAHAAEHGGIDTAATAPSPLSPSVPQQSSGAGPAGMTQAPPAAAAPTSAPVTGGATAGDFRLDDV